jgi:hypothetical protein
MQQRDARAPHLPARAARTCLGAAVEPSREDPAASVGLASAQALHSCQYLSKALLSRGRAWLVCGRGVLHGCRLHACLPC